MRKIHLVDILLLCQDIVTPPVLELMKSKGIPMPPSLSELVRTMDEPTGPGTAPK